MKEDSQKGGVSILIVDDEEDFLTAMKFWLEAKGFNVETAGSGVEALQKLQEHKPDVVFLDIMMPDMDGIDTLAQIRTTDKELPVILITAFGLIPRLQQAEKYGVTGFFRKSQDFNKAAALIENAIRKVNEA